MSPFLLLWDLFLNTKARVRILRRQLKRASLPFGRASPVGKILILLLESGGLYCMVWVRIFTASCNQADRYVPLIGFIFGNVFCGFSGNSSLHLSLRVVDHFLLYSRYLYGVLRGKYIVDPKFTSQLTRPPRRECTFPWSSSWSVFSGPSGSIS